MDKCTTSILVVLFSMLGCKSTSDGRVRSPERGHEAEPSHHSSPYSVADQDLGTGVLHLVSSPADGPYPREDTVLIHEAPDSASPVRAEFVLSKPVAHRYAYSVRTDRPDLIGNVLEFKYEESGLPLDSVTSAGWTRVVYARSHAGEFQVGWVAPEPERLAHVLWRDHLPQRSLYPLFPDQQPLRSAPGGEPISTPEAEAGYELVPMRVEGEWMQVRLRRSACHSGGGERHPERIAWIRYLDSDGRPRVWYYARGC